MKTSPFSVGLRIKSGHAIAIALAGPATAPAALGRFVVALSDPAIEETKQPYHDGFGTAQQDQKEIARLTKIIRRCAGRSIAALLKDERFAGRRCAGGRLVVGSLIDPAKVGNPHIRAHAHEGRLFRTVVEEALRDHGVGCGSIVEKKLGADAQHALRRSDADIRRTLRQFGETLGSPWRAEEKGAALAAWMAL